MKDRFKTFNSGRANFYLLGLIAILLVGAVLKITASVIIPFIIAFLLALVMNPMVSFLGKFRVPRFVSILLAVILVIAGLTIMGGVFFSSARSILRAYPRYEKRLTEIYVWLGNFFELSYNEDLSFLQNIWSQLGIRSQIWLYTVSLSNTFVEFAKDAVIVGVFLVFFLVEAVYFKEKLSVAFEGKWAGQIKNISTDTMRQVSRYLSTKFVLSVVNGLLVGVFLSLIGVEFAVVWGVIQFVLNFIPSLGSIAVGVAASAFALLQFWPEPGPVVLTVIIMLGVNISIGFVLEPKVMGDRLGLSPIVVLISLLIWGWLLGFVGMIMAVPLMVIIRIVCENVPVLEPVSVLLGSRRAVLAKKAKSESESAGEKIESDPKLG